MGFTRLHTPVIAISIAACTTIANAGDLLLAVEQPKQVVVTALAGHDLLQPQTVTRLPSGTYLLSKPVFALQNTVLQPGSFTSAREKEITPGTSAPCSLAIQSICWYGWDETQTGIVPDVTAVPLGSDAQAVKATIYEENLYLGDKVIVPFSVLSGLVANGANVSNANRLALLDPDLGAINFNGGGSARFRFGPFCQFVTTPGGQCALIFRAGARYLDLHQGTAPTTGDNTTTPQSGSSKGVFGGYTTVSLGFAFPIFDQKVTCSTDPSERMSVEDCLLSKGVVSETDSGLLAFKLGASYFAQSSGDSSGRLFPDAVDAQGNPIRVKNNFGEYNGSVSLKMPHAIVVSASYYKALGNSAVDKTAVVSVSYGFGQVVQDAKQPAKPSS